MGKNKLLIILISSILLFSCKEIHKTEFRSGYVADSFMHNTTYLLPSDSFYEDFEYLDVFYRYYDNDKWWTSDYSLEYVILAFSYDDIQYELAKKFIVNSPSYDYRLSFEYNNYHFTLNNYAILERIKKPSQEYNHDLTNYEITNDKISINWINLFSYNDNSKKLAFFGMHYSSSSKKVSEKYEVSCWGELFNNVFYEYDFS